LAIQSEEEDGKIYADLAQRIGKDIPQRRNRCGRCATRRMAIGIG
jgi:hypothetical protein